ncbi:MAG: hypothetical protein ACXV2C_06595 [Candidatus Bathyarchaeia archaeon]
MATTSVSAIAKHMTDKHGKMAPKTKEKLKSNGATLEVKRAKTLSPLQRNQSLKIHKLVSRWVNESGLPASLVRHPAFRDLVYHGIPAGYRPPSTELLKKLQLDDFKRVMEMSTKILLRRAKAATITADGWTSLSGGSYFGVLLHYVDCSNFLQTPLLLAVVCFLFNNFVNMG